MRKFLAFVVIVIVALYVLAHATRERLFTPEWSGTSAPEWSTLDGGASWSQLRESIDLPPFAPVSGDSER